MVLGGGTFGRQIGLDGIMRVKPQDGMSSYKKRERHQGSLSLCHVRIQQEDGVSQEESPSQELNSCHLDLGLSS